MNPILIQLAILAAIAAACSGGIVWGRFLRHRDLRRAQLARVREYRA